MKNEEDIVELLDSFERKTKPKAIRITVTKSDSNAIKQKFDGFVRRIQKNNREVLFIHLTKEKYLEKFGFIKGTLVKVYVKPNKIIIEKI